MGQSLISQVTVLLQHMAENFHEAESKLFQLTSTGSFFAEVNFIQLLAVSFSSDRLVTLLEAVANNVNGGPTNINYNLPFVQFRF